MRTGGTIRSIRVILIWLFILTILVFFYIKPKHENYKKLWKKVYDMEKRMNLYDKIK